MVARSRPASYRAAHRKDRSLTLPRRGPEPRSCGLIARRWERALCEGCSHKIATWHTNKRAQLKKNGHLTYVSDTPRLVRLLHARTLRRRDKGKPAARRGRKALGPLLERRPGYRTAVGSLLQPWRTPPLISERSGAHVAMSNFSGDRHEGRHELSRNTHTPSPFN